MEDAPQTDHELDESFRADFWAFVGSLERNWMDIGGRAVIVILASGLAVFFGADKPITSVICGSLVVLVAAFYAFRDERRKAARLQSAIDASNRISDIKDGLAELIVRGKSLRRGVYPQRGVDSEALRPECILWDKEGADYLRDNLNSIAVAKFTHPETPPEIYRGLGDLLHATAAKVAALESIAEAVSAFTKPPKPDNQRLKNR